MDDEKWPEEAATAPGEEEQPTQYISRVERAAMRQPAGPDETASEPPASAPAAPQYEPPPSTAPHTGLHRSDPVVQPAPAQTAGSEAASSSIKPSIMTTPAGTADAISLNRLTKHYGKSVGVEGLTLRVEQGEVFGFLGPNGAGKTTTIRLLLNLIFPTAGSATVFGQDIVRDTVSIRRNVGYVPGDVRLYGELTGRKTVNYFARIRSEQPTKLDSLVKRFDLDMNKKVRDMSRGNRQKLALILAFCFDPELYILDEPTSGLDPLMQQEFYTLIAEEKARNKTVFLSSHILPEVDKICDRVAVLKEGKLLHVESIYELRGKKMRYAEVTFSEDVSEADLTLPGVLVIAVERPRRYRLVIKGSEIGPILGKLAQHKVDDLSITHAPLEETFLEFYGKGNHNGGAV